MMHGEIVKQLVDLGVDPNAVYVAEHVAEQFHRLNLNGVMRVAVLQLVMLATIYAEEEIDGPAFKAKAERVVELLSNGDAEARRQVEESAS